MIFIENEGHNNPHLNLALEEYAVRNFKGGIDYLLFYINEPSIIIGRHQNTLEEINKDYIDKKGIHVVRRVSGGGAVYHDHGNLNFSFMTDYSIKNLNNFAKFTAPVIRVLNKLGVNAELKGRNDIVVNDRKISGNAQFSTGKRMLSHGTLLYDSEMSEVANALNVKMSKIQSKGHKSVRSRVANICEFMDNPMSTEEFRSAILHGLYEDRDDFETYHLTADEWKKVHELKAEKYDQWDWNYGHSPKFNIKRVKRFPIGEIDLRIFAEKGYITDFKIYGDFFNAKPISDLEDKMLGVRYEKKDIIEALEEFEMKEYFGNLPKEDFIDLVYGEDEE